MTFISIYPFVENWNNLAKLSKKRKWHLILMQMLPEEIHYQKNVSILNLIDFLIQPFKNLL